MALTYEPIATTTVETATTSITFSSIPSTYTDLRIAFVAKSDGGGPSFYVQFNGDTGNNYSRKALYGDGVDPRNFQESNVSNMTLQGLTNDLGLVIFDVFSYTGSTYKTSLAQLTDCSTPAVWRNVYLWKNTAAITSIRLFASSANQLGVGSTLTLYGIKAA